MVFARPQGIRRCLESGWNDRLPAQPPREAGTRPKAPGYFNLSGNWGVDLLTLKYPCVTMGA